MLTSNCRPPKLFMLARVPLRLFGMLQLTGVKNRKACPWTAGHSVAHPMDDSSPHSVTHSSPSELDLVLGVCKGMTFRSLMPRLSVFSLIFSLVTYALLVILFMAFSTPLGFGRGYEYIESFLKREEKNTRRKN